MARNEPIESEDAHAGAAFEGARFLRKLRDLGS
jgi:hypothetical protein